MSNKGDCASRDAVAIGGRIEPSRRTALALIGFVGALGASVDADAAAAPPKAPVAPPKDAQVVRLSSVVTPDDGGLYAVLLPDFTKQTGYRVELATGPDVFGPARGGRADVVLAHYGHNDLQSFMEGGFGQWPQTVFYNQFALFGPPDDPAGIKGVSDLVEAFRRIAAKQALYVVNDLEGIKYLGEILWEAAGKPARGSWYIDGQAAGPGAVMLAAQRQGYTIFGITPFLKMPAAARGNLAPLLLDDPLLQRIMVTIGVRPEIVAGVNGAGAHALQAYLVAARTQAMIRTFRLAAVDHQIWWPAGRNNGSAVLGVN